MPGEIGPHMLVHQHAPVHGDAAVPEESSIHAHSNAHRHGIRREVVSILHNRGESAVGLLLDMVQHLIAGHLDTLGLQILLGPGGSFRESSHIEPPLGAVHQCARDVPLHQIFHNFNPHPGGVDDKPALIVPLSSIFLR